jgi:hypothetical protein
MCEHRGSLYGPPELHPKAHAAVTCDPSATSSSVPPHHHPDLLRLSVMSGCVERQFGPWISVDPLARVKGSPG